MLVRDLSNICVETWIVIESLCFLSTSVVDLSFGKNLSVLCPRCFMTMVNFFSQFLKWTHLYLFQVVWAGKADHQLHCWGVGRSYPKMRCKVDAVVTSNSNLPSASAISRTLFFTLHTVPSKSFSALVSFLQAMHAQDDPAELPSLIPTFHPPLLSFLCVQQATMFFLLS